MKKTVKITKQALFFWLVFLVVFCSHDTLLFGTNADNRFILIRKAVPFLLVVCLLLLQPVIRIKKNALIKFLIVFILPIVSCFVNGEDMNNYIYRAAIMLCAMLFVLADEKDWFYQAYSRILFFLSIWSIGTYLVRVFLPGILYAFPTVYNTSGASFHFLLFSTVNTGLHNGLVRNSSIFREPGAFCVMLTVAILIEMGILRKMRPRYLVVYAAAMITTYSTAGYIILALLFVYYLFFERKVRYKGVLIAVLAVIVVFMATQTDLLSAEGAIFEKFKKGSNSYGSWLARLTSITTSLEITLRNPLCGIGRYALYDMVLAQTGVYRAVDNTNTIMVGFAAYGLLFGMMISWGCWRFVRRRQQDLIAAGYLFLILVLALSNEDMGQNILFYVLVFDGLCGKNRERKMSRSS